MTNSVIDNDLLFKGACYFLLAEMATVVGGKIEDCGILGAARFVCAKALEKRGLQEELTALRESIDRFAQLEPTESETSLAADMELEAQQRGLQLDAGESLLFSIAEARKLSVFATGDKRAIAAIEQLSAGTEYWRGRIFCLEETIRRILRRHDPINVRDRICSAEFVDRSLSICFGCASAAGDVDAWLSGLSSYIADLRRVAPTVLA